MYMWLNRKNICPYNELIESGICEWVETDRKWQWRTVTDAAIVMSWGPCEAENNDEEGIEPLEKAAVSFHSIIWFL